MKQVLFQAPTTYVLSRFAPAKPNHHKSFFRKFPHCTSYLQLLQKIDKYYALVLKYALAIIRVLTSYHFPRNVNLSQFMHIKYSTNAPQKNTFTTIFKIKFIITTINNGNCISEKKILVLVYQKRCCLRL